MIVFEYDSLKRTDFEHPEDFDYLLAQDLPCFQIQFKHGQPIIYVRYYLAVIELPSGCYIEILPKLLPTNIANTTQVAAANTNVNTSRKTKIATRIATKHQEQQGRIDDTRKWVQTMLEDTLGQVTPKPLDAPLLARQTFAKFNKQLGSQAASQHRFRATNIDNRDTATWHRWLVRQYIQRLQAISTLSPRHYQSQTHNSPKATGKLNIKSQIKQNWHRPHYRASEQTKLVDYTLLWRFLLTGYQQVQWQNSALGLTSATHKATVNQSSDYDELKEITHKFQGIKPLPINEWQTAHTRLLKDIKTWQRQLPHIKLINIEAAIAWAWWLIKPVLPFTEDGNQSMDAYQSGDSAFEDANGITLPKRAFMLNMNQLFEQWVYICLQRWCHSQLPGSRLVKQPSFEWLRMESHEPNENTVIQNTLIQRLRPDLCIYDANNEISHVIEIKYKQLDTLSAINSTDLYQLNSYQQHLQAYHAWLIYPQSDALTERIELSKRAGKNDYQDIKEHTDDKAGLNVVHATQKTSSGKLTLIPFSVQQGRVLI